MTRVELYALRSLCVVCLLLPVGGLVQIFQSYEDMDEVATGVIYKRHRGLVNPAKRVKPKLKVKKQKMWQATRTDTGKIRVAKKDSAPPHVDAFQIPVVHTASNGFRPKEKKSGLW